MECASTVPILDARFVLLDAIGMGGMGAVFRAFDRETERIVALKLLHREVGPGPAHPLSEEFTAWAKLRHPNIVRAFQLARADSGPLRRGTPYLVLEHFPGEPAHRILTPGRTSPRHLVLLARAVLEGLAHVHGVGLVHRDLKPGNVLVTVCRSGALRVKITDFGLAAANGARREPGRVSGSLAYVAPETILGGPIEARSDLYALGVLLWMLACGRLPFSERDPRRVLRWHIEGTTPDPRRRAPGLPDRLARFILRLTERDPSRRFPSAAAALGALGSPPLGSPSAAASVVGTAALASLRLAFDAARLGAWRVVVLDAEPERVEVLRREASVLAQVHGLALHRLDGDGAEALSRLVVRLLMDRGPRVRAVVERHGLSRGVPLGFFGGLPLWDRMRAASVAPPDDTASLRSIARGVAAFLAESFALRPTVLLVGEDAGRDLVVREVVARLRREAEGSRAAPGRQGGLLLVLPASATGRPSAHALRRVRAAARLAAGGVGATVLPETDHEREQRESELVHQR